MIIQNGYIEAMVLTNGGVDSTTGFAVAESVSYGTPIPCQYVLSIAAQKTLAQGEHTLKESYKVLIEEQPAGFNPGHVRLSDINGNVIGVFRVEGLELLVAVSEMTFNAIP